LRGKVEANLRWINPLTAILLSTGYTRRWAANRSMNLKAVTQAIPGRPRWAFAAAIVAVLFGALTVWAGGRALFGGVAARAEVGNAVGFVLWFNFLCGFFYVLAGVGLFFWTRWAAPLSAAIAMTTLLVFAAFGWHVARGGAFEMRTVWAMTLRSAVWIAIAVSACRALGCPLPRRQPRMGR
jgi:hypothetical protein